MIGRIVFGLFVVLLIGSGINHCTQNAEIERKAAADAEDRRIREANAKHAADAVREQRAKEFAERRSEILGDLRAKVAAKKWTEAREITDRFKDVSDPEYVEIAARVFDGWKAQEKAREAREKAAAEKFDRERRRREGVAIGMSMDDVAASSWGRPYRINETKTARGSTWQWVYDRGYVYFDEYGKVRAVQERHGR